MPPLNWPSAYGQELQSTFNRPLQWGLQDVIDQRENAMNDPWSENPEEARKKQETLENNYLTDAPWLKFGKQQNVTLVPVDHDPFAGELTLPEPSKVSVEKPADGEKKRPPVTLHPVDHDPFA